MNTFSEFQAAMRAAGLDYAGEIHADGRLHRFKADGDHARNSWFVLYPGNDATPTAGAFGCWKRGLNETWCDKRRESLTNEQWQAMRARLQAADEQRHKSEVERQNKAKESAAWIYRRAMPVKAHPYLSSKGVRVFGDVREHRGALTVPLRDMDDHLHSLQFIGADGSKKFLTGGRVAGCFFTLSDSQDGALVLCEGYATGASLHEATGLSTICVMNCGNLLAVAKVLRQKFQERDIIIAGDNDQFTDGNPGLTKASEAAKSIGARLVVPTLKRVATNPTDFNDLHHLEGLAEVKRQLEAAAPPKESESELLERLGALSPLEYERQRESEAKLQGCRVAVLDKLVQDKRPQSETGLQGRKIVPADAEPWPSSVNGADVLSEISNTFRIFVALPQGAADALALWCAHAHGFTAFQCTPRLNISSPEKGCGKTTLRDVVSCFVPRPLLTENMTTAVMFRVIDKSRPTLLADEADAWLRDNEELRGMLNAGHRRGGQALRCEGEGNEVREFNVFAPAVLCGIGALPGTLHDRSIVVRLERAKPGELLKRFDSRHVEPETELCRKLARFISDNMETLESSDPKLPEGAFNRLADNWRPLFAIAGIAGSDWSQRAAAAFASITSHDSEAQGIGTELLEDVRQVFSEARCERIFSKVVVERLCSMSDRPWLEAHRGKQITETWLAKKLRSFGIVPHTLRIGDERAKGYEINEFSEAFDRYLPAPGTTSRDTRDNTITTGISPIFQAVPALSLVTASKPHETIEAIGLSRCHASKDPAEALLL